MQKKDGRRSGARRQRRNKSTLTPFLHLAALLALLFASPSFASYGPDRLANPALEARAVALQKELRCVVCQSQSLDESDAPLAEDLRRLIRAHIAKGESDDRIKNYLVARYGDFILMNPPVEPDTYGLWFGPFIVLAIGGGGAAAVIARAHRRAKAQDAPAKDRALRQANGDREA